MVSGSRLEQKTSYGTSAGGKAEGSHCGELLGLMYQEVLVFDCLVWYLTQLCSHIAGVEWNVHFTGNEQFFIQ